VNQRKERKQKKFLCVGICGLFGRIVGGCECARREAKRGGQDVDCKVEETTCYHSSCWCHHPIFLTGISVARTVGVDSACHQVRYSAHVVRSMSTLDPKRMRKLTTLLERAIGVTATLFGGRSRAMLMCRMSTLSAELLGQVGSLGEGAVWVAIGMAAAGGATSTGAVRRMTALGAEGTGELGTLLLLERAVGVPVGVAGLVEGGG